MDVDPKPASPPKSPKPDAAPSPTVLGKRRLSEVHSVDPATTAKDAATVDEDFVMVDAPASSAPADPAVDSTTNLVVVETSDGVTEIGNASEVNKPPPLPPRKAELASAKKDARGETMMFGESCTKKELLRC